MAGAASHMGRSRGQTPLVIEVSKFQNLDIVLTSVVNLSIDDTTAFHLKLLEFIWPSLTGTRTG